MVSKTLAHFIRVAWYQIILWLDSALGIAKTNVPGTLVPCKHFPFHSCSLHAFSLTKLVLCMLDRCHRRFPSTIVPYHDCSRHTCSLAICSLMRFSLPCYYPISSYTFQSPLILSNLLLYYPISFFTFQSPPTHFAISSYTIQSPSLLSNLLLHFPTSTFPLQFPLILS